MLTLEVIVRGSSNFIGFRDICSKALLDAGFVVMLLLVLHLWGDLLEIGWRSDHFAASLFYYRISRGPKGSNISTSFIYSNSVHRLGDTLEETAYFLDLTTVGVKPVILVGAQRPASDPDSDGPRNLLDAVRVAIAPEAASKGVMVVMNGQISAARDVAKTNTNRVETFRGLEFGQLGVADTEKVRFYRAPLRRQTFAVDSRTQLGRVDIVMSYAGADGLVIRSLLRDDAVQGFVVAGTGLGDVSGSMFDAIQQVREGGIPVVISTRVPTGRVFPLGAGKGSALALKRIGCVLADDLSPQKARILLMLALTKTHDPAALQKYFDH